MQHLINLATNPQDYTMTVIKQELLAYGVTKDEMRLYGKLTTKLTYVNYLRSQLNLPLLTDGNQVKVRKQGKQRKQRKQTSSITTTTKTVSVEVCNDFVNDMLWMVQSRIAYGGSSILSVNDLNTLYNLQKDGNAAAQVLYYRYLYNNDRSELERVMPFNYDEERYYTEEELGVPVLLKELYGNNIPSCFKEVIGWERCAMCLEDAMEMVAHLQEAPHDTF